MFKNIMYIYWMKLKMFPVFVNNTFYYMIIKFKLKYGFINLLGAIFSLLNILTYPLSVLANLGHLLYRKLINDKETYTEFRTTLHNYYSKSKRNIIINRHNINKLINEE